MKASRNEGGNEESLRRSSKRDVFPRPGKIDSADEIYDRVTKALDYLPPGRITLDPDCGFGPKSAAKVSIDEVYQKLKNEVQAARRLRAL
jgi:methionine synthase II (cobalamin-independent)